MQQNLLRKTQKQAKEAKRCTKVQNEKAIEHSRQKVFKSETYPENQNCQNFVILNRRKSFEKFGRKMLENIKEFKNQGIKFIFDVFFFVYCMVFLI